LGADGTGDGGIREDLGTVSLTGREWIVCILVTLTIVAASELQKLIRRRRAPEAAAEEPAGAPALGATT
jgi:hypothetical protein